MLPPGSLADLCLERIYLGPEGGDGGGLVIAKGTPEDIARVADSPTGQYLAKTLGVRPSIAARVSAKVAAKVAGAPRAKAVRRK